MTVNNLPPFQSEKKPLVEDPQLDQTGEQRLYDRFNELFLNNDDNFGHLPLESRNKIISSEVGTLTKGSLPDRISKKLSEIAFSIVRSSDHRKNELETKFLLKKVNSVNKKFLKSTIIIWEQIIKQNEESVEWVDFQTIQELNENDIFNEFETWIKDNKEKINTTLDLQNRKIHFLPSQLFLLTSLTNLYLYNNKLRFIPKEIQCLEKLETLNLCYNPLLNKLPQEILELTKLKKISVYGITNFPIKQNISDTLEARGVVIERKDLRIDLIF